MRDVSTLGVAMGVAALLAALPIAPVTAEAHAAGVANDRLQRVDGVRRGIEPPATAAPPREGAEAAGPGSPPPDAAGADASGSGSGSPPPEAGAKPAASPSPDADSQADPLAVSDDGSIEAAETNDADPSATSGEGSGEDEGIWWGLERPTPRWKWAGFGVSAGLFAGTLGVTIGLATWLNSPNGGFRRDLLAAAQQSLEDENPYNDVDPSLPADVNLCDYAAARPTDPDTGVPLGEQGQVRNANISQLCIDADGRRRIMVPFAVTAALTGVSTLVFAGVLFIHRGARPSRKRQAWRRHRMAFDVGAVPGVGASLHLRGRF